MLCVIQSDMKCKMLQIWKLPIHIHVSVCMVCTMQGGMKNNGMNIMHYTL